MMTASLRAFLDSLIDYAGLFPPASLDMPHAVETYARHLDSDHAGMVARFVCPITRLDQFALKGGESLRKFAPIRVAGLASPMNHAGTMMGVAADDAAKVRIFEREGWGTVDVVEARLPDDLVDGDPSRIPLALERYESALRTGGMNSKRIFYEVNRTGGGWIDRGERVVAACTRVPHRGFKIRCGGTTADAYPSVEEVAAAIKLCAHLRVPFKATAGLHHPVRHDTPSGVTQHGFFNVFVAGLLASSLDSKEMNDLIGDRDLGHFSFSDDHLAWNEHKVALDAVNRSRRTFAISYGSCDVDEPVEDLREAGLL